MDVIDAICTRRAVRNYSSEPVDEAQLRALVDAAAWAPSAMNEQPWSFYVIRDPAVLTRISDEAKAHVLHNAPAALPAQRLEGLIGDEAFHLLYHAPAMILICATADGPWPPIDCSLAAENLMLAACAMGLGSCWIGFAQGWLGTPAGKALIGAPPAHIPLAPIIVGHPKGKHPPTPRKAAEIRWL